MGLTAKGISAELERAIHDGTLSPGDPLPSVRSLADQRAVAPGTVASAYKALQSRGLVESQGRRGTFVRQRVTGGGRAASLPVGPEVMDLSRGQPDPALLPVLPWRSARHRRAAAPTELLLPELVDLAQQRFAADGVPSGPVTVTSGTTDAIHRVLAARLRPGDIVAVEDPGWPILLDVVAGLGMRVEAVLLDNEGPLPESLDRVLRAGASTVVLTPRGQNPTGVEVSAPRSAELRRVLSGFPGVLTVEDDHSADLINGKLHVVAGATEAWVYARSTSKSYGPDLRVSLLTGDSATISTVQEGLRNSGGWVSTLLQQLVADLWTSERAAACVSSAYDVYSHRRQTLVTELLKRGVVAQGTSGMNVWVSVPDETTAVARLLQAKWLVSPGARFGRASAPAIRITVSGLSARAAPRLAADIALLQADTGPTGYAT